MNVERILEGAIETIKQGWTQSELAENAAGDPVDSLNSSAVQWCIIGALSKSAGYLIDNAQEDTPAFQARRELEISLGGGFLTEWNDACDRSSEDVVSLLKRTLERIRNESEGRT